MSVTPTDLAAWYGAAIATISVGWNIHAWRKTKGQIIVDVQPNMKILAWDGSITGGQVSVTATNAGDLPEEITHVMGFVYKSWLHQFFQSRSANFVVDMSDLIPHVIEPGRQSHFTIPEKNLIKFAREARLYLGVKIATRREPFLVRLDLSHLADQTDPK
jgi:hypothetical protein